MISTNQGKNLMFILNGTLFIFSKLLFWIDWLILKIFFYTGAGVHIHSKQADLHHHNLYLKRSSTDEHVGCQ